MDPWSRKRTPRHTLVSPAVAPQAALKRSYRSDSVTRGRSVAFLRVRAALTETRTGWLWLASNHAHTRPPRALRGRPELRVGWFDGNADGGRYTLADYAAAFDLVLPAHSALGLAPLVDLLRP